MSKKLHLSEKGKVCAYLVVSLFFMSVISSASVFINSDLNPPSWRGQDGSTFARWEFITDSTTTPVWDEGSNPYGQTWIQVFPSEGHVWIDQLDGAFGVWALSGQIAIDVDNRPERLDKKLIQIQLVWRANSESAIPGITIYDNERLTISNIVPTIERPLSDNSPWTYSVYNVAWPYNPSWERILVFNGIYIDALVVDTICIPEPSTYCILMAGAAFFYRIRKKYSL